jgi:hypothetical protein
VLDTRGPLNAETFSAVWGRYHQRWRERGVRMDRIDRAARGEWAIMLPDDDTIEESSSPNLILAGLEDTAEAASLVPSVRVKPSATDPRAKEVAAKMEQIGTSYLEASEIELLTLRSLLNLAGYGMFSWVVIKEPGCPPRIQWRNPRTCFPEPEGTHLGVTNRCFFARDLYLTQLPDEWRRKFEMAQYERGVRPRTFSDDAVTIIEYFDLDETVIAGVYDSNVVEGIHRLQPSEPPNWVTVILEREENKSKMSPVIVGQRMTLDGEPRGQFDQVIGVMEAHIRLQQLTLDYADQSVYSDMWVKDLIGKMPLGGGSYIQLGPQGEIGRVPPAVSSMTVHQELQQLADGLHLGGRWPKSRQGETDSAIITGRALEVQVAMMNTVIRTYHLLCRRAFKQALRVMFRLDHDSREKRSIAGAHRNQQYALDVDTRKDIDLSADVDVTYGLGLGRSPSESMVMGIQAAQAGIVSLEFVQENFEGIEDVNLEKIRVDTQAIRDMMFADILEGTKTGAVPKSALPAIMRDRQNGKMIADLYEKYIVKPAEEQDAMMLTSGLTGQSMMPGMAPPQQGGMVPPAPPPEELLGALSGAMAGPGGGEEPQTINRTSVPTGPGSFSGVQTGG